MSNPNTAWPHDADGNPMALVTGSVQDTVPTVQYGSVRLFASITRPVPNGTHQDLINETRLIQRDAEFCVGVERRALQGALDPNYKFVSPVVDDHQFAAPPNGYDPSSMPPHPADAANAPAVDGAAKS